MSVSQKEYKQMIRKTSPGSPVGKDCLMAFSFGGGICLLGQVLFTLYGQWGLSEQNARTLVSVTLIFLAVLLTACHQFDKIAKIAGAGTLVPITGFANAMASPAMEFKREGAIMGLGAKMFIIAGPVLVYGLAAGMVYGLILWIF